jgi:hypothetical protein
MNNQLQKKLTDLLRKLTECQLPSKGKGGKPAKSTEKHDHPNFTNFTTITAA